MDTSGGPWDAVVCAFGVSELTRGLSHPDLNPTPAPVLSAWGDALTPGGKVGLLLWGPLEPDDPHTRMLQALAELEPQVAPRLPDPSVGRREVAALLEAGGLALARHTTVTHDLMFRTAEHFALAVRRACSWRATFDALGDVRTGKVLARFYDSVGGPEKPLVYQPTATLAIAALPGAEIELPHRPSVRLPKR
jgi:SAM-dependent methyltransferase